MALPLRQNLEYACNMLTQTGFGQFHVVGLYGADNTVVIESSAVQVAHLQRAYEVVCHQEPALNPVVGLEQDMISGRLNNRAVELSVCRRKLSVLRFIAQKLELSSLGKICFGEAPLPDMNTLSA